MVLTAFTLVDARWTSHWSHSHSIPFRPGQGTEQENSVPGERGTGWLLLQPRCAFLGTRVVRVWPTSGAPVRAELSGTDSGPGAQLLRGSIPLWRGRVAGEESPATPQGA